MAYASSIHKTYEIFIFSLVDSHALLISTSASKSSKAANLFESST
jgi:hypothetical protein